MERYNYFTTRTADKTRFCAVVTTQVEGEDEFFIMGDLMNVIALVEVNTETNERLVHVMLEDEMWFENIGSDPDYLWNDAQIMSQEYDQGASGDFSHTLPQNHLFVGGMDVTFYMDLDKKD